MPAQTTDHDDVDQTSGPVAASTARLLALVGGLIALVAAIATPLLPVNTTTSTITWPQGQDLNADNASIYAPLIARSSQGLDIIVPCAPLAELSDSDDTILATVPSASSKQASTALVVAGRNDRVTVSFRTSVAATATREELSSPPASTCTSSRRPADPAHASWGSVKPRSSIPASVRRSTGCSPR